MEVFAFVLNCIWKVPTLLEKTGLCDRHRLHWKIGTLFKEKQGSWELFEVRMVSK